MWRFEVGISLVFTGAEPCDCFSGASPALTTEIPQTLLEVLDDGYRK
jgi:hypothetical protein